jgi:hypothetical protein
MKEKQKVFMLSFLNEIILHLEEIDQGKVLLETHERTENGRITKYRKTVSFSWIESVTEI